MNNYFEVQIVTYFIERDHFNFLEYHGGFQTSS